MDIEKAISSEIPSFSNEEKKKKKHGKDTNTAENHDSEKERRKGKRKKTNDNLEESSMDHDTTLLVPKQSKAANLDHGVDIITRVKKEKKKKITGSDSDEMNIVGNERTSLEPESNVTSSVTEGMHKRTKRSSDKVETTTADTSSEPNFTLGKKEKKKKMKRKSDGIEMTTVVNEPEDDVKSGKKKKIRTSDDVEVKTNVDHDCSKVDDTSEKKKKKKKKKMKKKAQRSGDDETIVVDDESPEDALRNAIIEKEEAKSNDINLDPIVEVTSGKKNKSKKKSSNLVLTETEGIMSLENGADVSVGKKKMKRERRVETGSIEGCECQESEVNGIDQATSLVGQDSALTSKNTRKKKKKSESQNHHDIDHEENQSGPTSETIATEIDVPIESEGTNSEKPSASEDMSCADENKSKKKKKKKKNIQESLEATAMDNVVVDKIESVQASENSSVGVAEQVHAESSLSLVNSIDLEKNIMGLVTEVSGVRSELDLDLELGKIKTYKRKRIREDCSEVKKSSNSGDNDVDPPDLRLGIVNKEGPERTLVTQTRKKLLILDVNGLLVDFVSYIHNYWECKGDITISKKHVFRRPYCDEFIQFCLENFTVAVWSSRMKWNVEKVVDFIFGDLQKKLLFCWDQSHCTMTGFNTIENQSKPLVLKELKKVWDKVEPDLPYEKGDYDETNTLLLDDSPYKALRNPANTAIFPKSYSYTDKEDKSLGPGGELRSYLEGLLLTDNVQMYVQQNPFGQQPITESHRSWDFYERVIKGKAKTSKNYGNSKLLTIDG